MAGLDELDEYDAERELAIKREYHDVYSLFRYYVVTRDGTYLCNQVTIEQVPDEGALTSRVTIEDAWVWDPNRPARLLERAEILTTDDVTIEVLKGDDATLTADDVSKRLGLPEE